MPEAVANPLSAAAFFASKTNFSCSVKAPEWTDVADLTKLELRSLIRRAGGEGVRDCAGLGKAVSADAGEALRDAVRDPNAQDGSANSGNWPCARVLTGGSGAKPEIAVVHISGRAGNPQAPHSR
mmetsp:Transcript_54567/g.138632  ORF Transcript_54567/g.138632 Transcript_54567/m.138632 type:complete len:125 (-) Transcript_54567:34-408(-)